MKRKTPFPLTHEEVERSQGLDRAAASLREYRKKNNIPMICFDGSRNIVQPRKKT